MKRITIDGRLGKDSEVKMTPKGRQYLRLTIANDTYTNGEVKTEWYDVTTFDQFCVEKKSEFLKKGRYVIVSGIPSSSVNTSNGKIYLNQSIMADSIELPSIGNGRREDNQVNETVSTFSPAQRPQQPAPQPQAYQPQATQRPQPVQQAYVPQQTPAYQPQVAPTPVQAPQPQAYQPQVAPQPQAYQPQTAPVQQGWQAKPAMFSDNGSEDDDLPF